MLWVKKSTLTFKNNVSTLYTSQYVSKAVTISKLKVTNITSIVYYHKILKLYQ